MLLAQNLHLLPRVLLPLLLRQHALLRLHVRVRLPAGRLLLLLRQPPMRQEPLTRLQRGRTRPSKRILRDVFWRQPQSWLPRLQLWPLLRRLRKLLLLLLQVARHLWVLVQALPWPLKDRQCLPLPFKWLAHRLHGLHMLLQMLLRERLRVGT